MSPLATQDAALDPVRAAMLRRATERADRIVGQARDAVQALAAEARSHADAAVAQARSDGAAQARPVAAAELNRSRRAARSVALGANLAANDEIAGRIRAAVVGLRDEQGYPELRDRLARAARRAAGPQAEVSEHPAGGVVARAGGVVVDCSLPRLADRAVAALGPRIAGLCGS
ncbi:MAG TPA: hypothetical protein VMU94_02850 [Streptosporangiaceae bacterium]|nr:hypothetical protein [Streptosporangiaceae bacterium]